METTLRSVSAVGVGALFAMTAQKSVSSMLLHESTTRVAYPVAVAVCLGEVVKMIVSLLIVCYESTKRKRTWTDASLWQSLLSTKGFALFLPAALYVVQNNLYMFAASHLTPTVFQALWQLRIISTAFFSYTILKKRFSRGQCVSMTVLVFSIVMIEAGSRSKAVANTIEFKPSTGDAGVSTADALVGSLAMLCACVLSGLAGVLLERIYTDGATNLWVANVHLSVFSLPPAVLAVAARLAHERNGTHLEAFGQSGWPWVAVALHSLGGVLTALVTKHAGNIAKNFSGAIAISITFLLSTSGFLPGGALTLTGQGLATVWAGIALLAYSTWLYLESPAAVKPPPDRAGYTALASSTASEGRGSTASSPTPSSTFSEELETKI